ncbi:MAG: MFS transporter, partial [Candidatus Binatia bacterium]
MSLLLNPYLAFLACAVIQSIATTGADALLPFYVKSLGISTALAGLPFIMNSVARVFVDPFLGVIADRLSSKSFLLLSLLLGAASALLAGMIPRLTPFLFFWIFTGISASMFAVGMRKIAFENARLSKEGSAVGNITTLYGIGNVAGPPMAGFLGSLWGTRVLFISYALPLLWCMGLCW